MPSLKNLLPRHRFPSVHIAAIAICSTIIAITLLLLPTESVEAKKAQIPLDLPAAETVIATPTSPTSKSQPATAQPVAVEPPVLAEEPVVEENWVSYQVEKNDNLTSLFKRAGLTATDVYYVAKATEEGKELNRLYPGETLSFLIEGGELQKVRYEVNALKTIFVERQPASNTYSVRLQERTPVSQQRLVEGTIENSLFLDAEAACLSANMIMKFAAIYGWDLDFSQDLRKGDQFRVLYNEQYLDGKKINDGHIVAAQFINKDQTYTAIRYTDAEGNSSYFTPEGQSMRKAFLRMPVDFARISSHFNLSRRHPVLNKIRAHKGVDYAARTGTPIKASGDGKVIFRGKKGGYGNVIILKHGGNITTLYAHMSKFRSKVKQGSWVKQGQVIGYVGKTGLATGPHLHYEFRVNGVHKNPMKVKFPHAQPVPKDEQARFQTAAAHVLQQLDTFAATQYARAGNN